MAALGLPGNGEPALGLTARYIPNRLGKASSGLAGDGELLLICGERGMSSRPNGYVSWLRRSSRANSLCTLAGAFGLISPVWRETSSMRAIGSGVLACASAASDISCV